MAKHAKIVSLIASSTEIVCALGFRNQIIGRSHECDFPESIKTLPQCTSPKFPTDGTSYQIDERIKAIVQEGLSVYRVDNAVLEKLQPTHIFTQDQCEVCAVSLKDVEEAVCEITSSNPKVVSLKTDCLEDLFRDIKRVAKSLDAETRGETLVAELKNRIHKITSMCRQAREPEASNKIEARIACVEWIDPLMSAGNWMPELIALAGGRSLFGETGKHSPWMTWEELIAADPDILFVSPCGFDIKRTLEEMHVLEKNPAWKKLKAVRDNRVVIADGNQHFHRPGPRLVESLEILAEIFHGLHFGHKSRGWIEYKS